ncbi:hypothetical protein AAFF_G00035390 [Aldrovandia affinis]|uniref:Uncharacterized protein n=1 Tax=Aldrovandia affinis TaxID=143900 RepID=A0AAD7WFN4_9TELE|nr:hypothetical protein AAFF_G00035390 [Aldrovandia affinis]
MREASLPCGSALFDVPFDDDDSGDAIEHGACSTLLEARPARRSEEFHSLCLSTLSARQGPSWQDGQSSMAHGEQSVPVQPSLEDGVAILKTWSTSSAKACPYPGAQVRSSPIPAAATAVQWEVTACHCHQPVTPCPDLIFSSMFTTFAFPLSRREVVYFIFPSL